MKIVTLLLLALVLVSSKSISRTRKSIERIQLLDIYNELTKLTGDGKKDLKPCKQFVPDVVNYQNSTKEDFCKAAKITSGTHECSAGIFRLFKTYAGEQNCTINNYNKRELQLKKFLEHMKHSVQKILFNFN